MSIFKLTLVILLSVVILGVQSSSAQEASPGPSKGMVVKPEIAQTSEAVIKQGELLTLQRAVEIAIKNQPNILAAMGAVNASESRIGQARSNYYPQVNLSTGYNLTNPVVNGNGSSGVFSHNGRTADQFSAGGTVTQNIYDFGRTSTQVGISRLNLQASRSDLENVSEQIAFNVKQAYFTVIQAQRNKVVAQEAIKQYQLHLEQAKGFYEVGTKPKFDVTRAQVDLSNAQLSLIRADNALKLAIVNLNNAMGVPAAPEYVIEDTLAFQKYQLALQDALTRAFAQRGDVQAITTRTKASEQSVNLAQKGYNPFVTGSAGYNYAGDRFPLDNGWNAGVTMSIPIFNGFLTKYQVEEARGNLEVARANEELVKQNVVQEVQQAFLNLREAEERIPTAELAVTQAKENLDIATGRYAAGVGNPIEVTDAEVAYSNAQLTYIQALTDSNIARASLQRAMGER